jgi:hypothetical protein
VKRTLRTRAFSSHVEKNGYIKYFIFLKSVKYIESRVCKTNFAEFVISATHSLGTMGSVSMHQHVSFTKVIPNAARDSM